MGNPAKRTENERSVKTAPAAEPRTASETIAHAARRVLRPLADEAEDSLERLARGKGGAKRVHRLRAALRKMDVLITTLGVGFDAREVGPLSTCVRRVRKAAGGVRDLDVMMAVLERVTEQWTDRPAASGLVRASLASRREKALRSLEKQGQKHAGAVKRGVRAMLDAPAGRRARLPARTAAIGALAREAAAMRAALRAGLHTPEHLHELRLNLKEARTVLDAMAGSLGPAAAGLAERARALSDTLGEVNDLATLAELLEKLTARGPRTRREEAAALLAVVRATHAKGHREAVGAARREIPALVDAIREVSFGEEEAAA